MAEIGVAPENIAVISGIGCSSRLPHYMATYGMKKYHNFTELLETNDIWEVK